MLTANPRVLILGAGVVGRAAARYAAASPAVGSIIVADRDLAVAERAAATRKRARAVSTDATDGQALAALMREADIVLNCIGPFFRFGPPILAAAIEAGRAYLDICDDPEPTLAMLDMDAAARAAGVTAVVGQGASPGTANMLAMLCAAEVPGAHTLLTGWSLDDDPGDTESAANEHWIEQATGTIKLWRGGALTEEPPLFELEVELPGYPPRTALTIGHPEAVTLPRRLPSLDTCLNVMTLPAALAETLQRAAHAVKAEGLAPLAASRRELARHVPGAAPALPVYPGVWALAIGPGGRAGAWLPDYGTMTDMATTTAAPLVAGLELVLAGKTAGPGVAPPEASFTPADYFAALGHVAGIGGDVARVVRG